MDFERTIYKDIQHSATQYPVVTVLGPRQSGKTTAVRKIFSEKAYANLELPDVRDMATNDPRGFLSQYPEGAVIDEIQRAPELLSYIQVMVDENDRPGLFILTGSQQLELNEAITQSLAGRTDIIKLLPLSLSELRRHGNDYSADEYLINGFYPRLYRDNLEAKRFYRNYFETYVQRDVRSLLAIKDLNKFERFVRLCAGRVGQIFNASELSGEVGVSSHTIDEWFSVLEASFVAFRLKPFFANVNKRLVKSPKIYFYDTGLASYLLNIETTAQMSRDPLRGNLFENLVVVDLIKSQFNVGKEPNLYFYRDGAKNEVDLIYQKENGFNAIEIKSAKTFDKSFVKKLQYLQKTFQEKYSKGFLIYQGDLESTFHETRLLNYLNSDKVFE